MGFFSEVKPWDTEGPVEKKPAMPQGLRWEWASRTQRFWCACEAQIAFAGLGKENEHCHSKPYLYLIIFDHLVLFFKWYCHSISRKVRFGSCSGNTNFFPFWKSQRVICIWWRFPMWKTSVVWCCSVPSAWSVKNVLQLECELVIFGTYSLSIHDDIPIYYKTVAVCRGILDISGSTWRCFRCFFGSTCQVTNPNLMLGMESPGPLLEVRMNMSRLFRGDYYIYIIFDITVSWLSLISLIITIWYYLHIGIVFFCG